jgi:putative nucleotidyltransferase with HDIG domain
MRPFYRVWQFGQVVTARPLDKKKEAAVKAVLSPAQQRLFGRFSASEQQHSYRVYTTLRKEGHDDPDLLAAALLHDIGKSCMPRTWLDRVIVVLGQAFLPGRAAVWAQGKATRLTRPFIVKANHAQWGAELAETAGSSPTTVALIRHHHHPPSEVTDEKIARLLEMLQWADDNS